MGNSIPIPSSSNCKACTTMGRCSIPTHHNNRDHKCTSKGLCSMGRNNRNRNYHHRICGDELNTHNHNSLRNNCWLRSWSHFHQCMFQLSNMADRFRRSSHYRLNNLLAGFRPHMQKCCSKDLLWCHSQPELIWP
ncbi:hypothetical protein SDC9_176432 [bioreactor metagenome]|uniref:Uncharacterized protein n=1 Tax=bioreactor metagenome TaxID=1076179 RepID=A0A645GQM8_9ZZZZ